MRLTVGSTLLERRRGVSVGETASALAALPRCSHLLRHSGHPPAQWSEPSHTRKSAAIAGLGPAAATPACRSSAAGRFLWGPIQRVATLATVLCVLYDDPIDGYPK